LGGGSKYGNTLGEGAARHILMIAD